MPPRRACSISASRRSTSFPTRSRARLSATCCTASAPAGRARADLVLFARQMYSITKSGLPLLRGLQGPRAVDAQRHSAQRAARRAAEPGVGARLRELPGAPPGHLPAAVPQHGAGRRVDRHARQCLLAAVRVPEPGPGRAGSGQDRGALSADRGRRHRHRADDHHGVRDPELRAAVQDPRQRHPAADARSSWARRRSCARTASRCWRASARPSSHSGATSRTESGRYRWDRTEAAGAGARRAAAPGGAVARHALAVDLARRRAADDPGADAAVALGRQRLPRRAAAAAARRGRARRRR